MVSNWMKPLVLALVVLCVLLCGAWGYQRIDNLSTQLVEAQASLQDVRDTMASQKALDATRVKLDNSVLALHKEIQKTNDLTRRLFDGTDHTTLPDTVLDRLHKGCSNIGVACIPDRP